MLFFFMLIHRSFQKIDLASFKCVWVCKRKALFELQFGMCSIRYRNECRNYRRYLFISTVPKSVSPFKCPLANHAFVVSLGSSFQMCSQYYTFITHTHTSYTYQWDFHWNLFMFRCRASHRMHNLSWKTLEPN